MITAIWHRLSLIAFFVVLGWVFSFDDYCASAASYLLAGTLVYAWLRGINPFGDDGKLDGWLLLSVIPLGAIILAFQQSELHDAICTVVR